MSTKSSAQGAKQKVSNKKKNVRNGNAGGVVRMDVPAAIGMSIPTAMPRFQSRSGDSVCISRREFVTSVSNGSSTSFMLVPQSYNIPGFDINPGCSVLFPWLSGVAQRYERYRFRSLSFQFVPSSSTSTSGRYYAAVDYDFDDPPATSKIAMMGNRTANEATVWQPFSLACDPKELHRDQPYRYVSAYSRNNYIEPRTAYCGFLMVGFDTTTADRLCDMWVQYDVELVAPVSDLQALQDNITGWVAPTASNVTVASGTEFYGEPPVNSTISGPIKVVVPGAPNIPPMEYIVGGATQIATRALDLFGALATNSQNGKLELDYRGTVTGVSPATVIGTRELEPTAQLYDAAGVALGSLQSVTGAVVANGTPNLAAFLSTAGSVFSKIISVPLRNLLASYPTARYLIPYVYSKTACGAGTSGFGYRVEL